MQREDALVDELRVNVPKALKDWDEEAIHQARVATRRLKAGLDLMKPVLSGEHTKPFAKVLKKLWRRLWPLRVLDVMIGHLEALAVRNRTQRPAIQWLLERLRQSRITAREESTKHDSPGRVLARLGTWWGVREEVAAAREAIHSLIAEQLHLQLDSFGERADRLVAASNPSHTAKSDAVPDDPHELRIAGKALRYTLEMAEIEGHDLPKKIMKGFKQMQESLGLWHDYVVLSERVMQVSLEALLPHHNAPLQGQLLDLAKNMLQRSTKNLTDFASLWASRGQELSSGIRQAFPLSRPVPPTGDMPAIAPAEPLVTAPEDAPKSESTEVPAAATSDESISAPQTDPDPPDSAESQLPEASAPDAASTARG
jgi:CHAD domain-containing protein